MNCPSCGAVVGPAAKFCMRCRRRLDPGAPQAPQAQANARPLSPGQGTAGRNPAQNAALASLLTLPILFLVNAALRGSAQEGAAAAALVVVGNVLLSLIGAVSGVAALVLVRRYGRERAFGRAIVGTLICSALLAANVGVTIVALRDRLQKQRALAEASRSAESLRSETKGLADRAAGGEDVSEEALAAVGRFASDLRGSSANMSATDRAYVEALAEAMERTTRDVKVKSDAVSAFAKAGGISPKGLATRAAIQARIALLDACERANEQLLASVPTWPDHFRQGLIARGYPGDRIEGAVQRYSKRLNASALLGIHEIDREAFARMREILVVLQVGFGRWTYDPKSDSVTFADPGLVPKYNAALQAVNLASAKQTELQQRFVAQNRASQSAQ